MPKTALMDWEYPAEEQEPWFDLREAFDKAVDRAVYSQHEIQHTKMVGGGTIAFAVPPTLTWSAAIELVNLVTGKITTIAAGSITMADGEILYINVARPQINTVTAPPLLKTNALGVNLGRQLLGFRRGVKVYLINGSSY